MGGRVGRRRGLEGSCKRERRCCTADSDTRLFAETVGGESST